MTVGLCERFILKEELAKRDEGKDMLHMILVWYTVVIVWACDVKKLGTCAKDLQT